MTVHNLAFQGRFGAGIFGELGLPAAAMSLDGVEYYGGVGFLKAGLQAAWAITTVSPTYAQEIRTPDFGMGLDGLVSMRAADLHGIVNGIDVEIWDPQTDAHLKANYSQKTLKSRAANKKAVEERFGLDPRRQPDLLRGQQADLAEGHGHTDRRARRAGRDRRAAGRAGLGRRGAGGRIACRRRAPSRQGRRGHRL